MEPRSPASGAAREGTFDPRPARVQAWLAGLPRANIGETTRRLFHALQDTNAQAIPAAQRFDLLERLRPVVLEMLQALQRHYLGARFPLPERNRRVAELAGSLLHQLAQAYRRVVDDEWQRPRLLRDGRRLQAAVHRALDALSLCLRQSYLVYAPPPRGIWRALHEIATFARERGLDRPPQSIPPGETSAPTARDLYKQTLLFSLACPYRLRQEEMRWLEARLAHCARFARLLEPGAPGAADALFAVPIDGDEPPGYLDLLRPLLAHRTHLLFETRDLVEACTGIDREAADLPDPPGTTTLTRALLAWGAMPRRRFTRRDLEAEVEVTLGLSATHHYLLRGREADCLTEEPGVRFEIVDPAEEARRPRDVWELAGVPTPHEGDALRPLDLTGLPGAVSEAPEDGSGTDTGQARPPHAAPPVLQRWRLRDISAGGMRLSAQAQTRAQVEVGELVGIREPGTRRPHALGLGVIRWLKCDGKAGVEIGIETIAPQAVPVGARPADSDNAYLPGLLLPELPAVRQPPTLVLTTLPFRVGDRIEVCTGQDHTRVELTRLVENTGRHAQYRFRPCERRGEKAEAPAQADAFDDLWQAL
ncbi:MAG: hypothetical protein D6721_03910 [Gammaproteobacteria bacterium]|nr:MAG: hypothetical protein D6721_03910 [Gammaproteobacteria bacterium]